MGTNEEEIYCRRLLVRSRQRRQGELAVISESNYASRCSESHSLVKTLVLDILCHQYFHIGKGVEIGGHDEIIEDLR